MENKKTLVTHVIGWYRVNVSWPLLWLATYFSCIGVKFRFIYIMYVARLHAYKPNHMQGVQTQTAGLSLYINTMKGNHTAMNWLTKCLPTHAPWNT